jgi:hypothetical protein
MPKSPIETYTISTHPSYSPSSNTSRVEIPSNGNDIRIIITEPSPTAPNPPLTRTKSPNTMPTIEIFEVPPTNRHNISRGLQTDPNNTSVASWIVTQNSSSTSERYIDMTFFKHSVLFLFD